jgi:hypothetical protein
MLGDIARFKGCFHTDPFEEYRSTKIQGITTQKCIILASMAVVTSKLISSEVV